MADALHAQVGHADLLAEYSAHLMVTAKANQPKLFAQLKTLPWSKVPVGAQTRETGHGRKETRTVKGTTSRETAYLTISLPAGQARSSDLGAWAPTERRIDICSADWTYE